ncbi:MAG TPA: hypothetical protein VK395_03095 [Gemmataceae bacterium]|nr:hypothetical protein [Gemmataceae bacterium]
MSDENGVLDFPARKPHRGLAALTQEKEKTTDEARCAAFGFLRGLDQRALAVEFRFRDGNSDWFPYSLLALWRHNPSVGLLLKFTGDLVTLVLIRGSNLDAVLRDKEINLTDRGFQRHRITFVREMDEDELGKAGEGEPTIDRIEVAECESNEEVQAWLKKVAPAFIRGHN